jgi:uncharacterized protein with HEPN domain
VGREVLLRLGDMRENIRECLEYTGGMTEAALNADRKSYSACLYRIQVVAEAAHDLPDELLARYPGVNWKELVGMGNLLKHQYFRVETNTVWDVVDRHFPVLLKVVERMIEEASESEPAI